MARPRCAQRRIDPAKHDVKILAEQVRKSERWHISAPTT
jgi:hypothetical protein